MLSDTVDQRKMGLRIGHWIWQCQVTGCVLSPFSHVQLFATLWIVACQAPLFMDSPSKNTWGGGCHAKLKLNPVVPSFPDSLKRLDEGLTGVSLGLMREQKIQKKFQNPFQ